MDRVLPPKRGLRLRYDRGRADGVFVMDGKRTHRLLDMLDHVARTPGGRRRSERQIRDHLLRRWDAKRAELEAELAARRGDGLTVTQVFGRWREWAEAEGYAEATITLHYERAVDDYLAANGDHPIAETGLGQLDKLKARLARRKLAPATVNLRLAKIGALLRWAERRELIDRVPRIEKLREPRRRARTMDAADVRKLLERLHRLIAETPHPGRRYHYELHQLLLVILLGTGMRRGEPFGLRWADVDLEGRLVVVRRPKERDEKLVVLPELVVAYLERWKEAHRDHTWLFDDGKGGRAYTSAHALTTAFRRHLKALGLHDGEVKPLHGYRAGFTTVGLDTLGLEPVAIQAQLGHHSLSTTQGYVASMLTAQRRAVRAYERRYLRPLFDRMESEGETPKRRRRGKPKT